MVGVGFRAVHGGAGPSVFSLFFGFAEFGFFHDLHVAKLGQQLPHERYVRGIRDVKHKLIHRAAAVWGNEPKIDGRKAALAVKWFRCAGSDGGLVASVFSLLGFGGCLAPVLGDERDGGAGLSLRGEMNIV